MQQKAVFTHYLSFGPATSRPSRPSIGSSGRLFPPSFDCCAAVRSSSFTACSARYPSYINASVEGKMRRTFCSTPSMGDIPVPKSQSCSQALQLRLLSFPVSPSPPSKPARRAHFGPYCSQLLSRRLLLRTRRSRNRGVDLSKTVPQVSDGKCLQSHRMV